MNLKMNFLHSYLDYVPTNLGITVKNKAEDFIKISEKWSNVIKDGEI